MSKFLLVISLLVAQLAAVSAQADAAPRRLRRKVDLFQVEDKATHEDKARKLHLFTAEFDNELEAGILDGEDGEWNRLLQDGSMSMSMPMTRKAHDGMEKLEIFD